MEQPLEDRLSFSSTNIPSDPTNIEYFVRINPETGYVQYQFPGNPKWIDSD